MRLRTLAILALVAVLLTGCFRRKKYENPITQDTTQPDKVLFDKAIRDLEKGRYQVARLTLQTLINTYDTSEFLAKSKLAIADSWFREGGSHGLAQAEAEYKDFILFYPTLEESAEAQSKICMIHYRQMEKPDRDPTHAIRADDECRQLTMQFPNSKFAPQSQQRLREIQEVIAEGEYRVGDFYFKKGSYPASTNRLDTMVSHYPLFSQADEALWRIGEAYGKMGPRFQDKSAEAYQRIVREYPLSPLADDAKKRLRNMEREIPEADPVAIARMEYERENTEELGMSGKFWSIFKKSPNVKPAAKSGAPANETLRPSVPVSVPTPGATREIGGDVTASTPADSSALDSQPDARRNPAKPEQPKKK
ncbi:MAG: outer membrane protein assembly factor BamD [Bryobacteraceae bacterium]|nr:outer membrane protein assembly factor BamD [Bryobacteraceae bacterium]